MDSTDGERPIRNWEQLFAKRTWRTNLENKRILDRDDPKGRRVTHII